MQTINAERPPNVPAIDDSPDEPTDIEELRRHRKERVAATLRLFAAAGFAEGAAGHVTARDPEVPDHFWVNPLSMHFSQVKASDLLLIDADGIVIEGRRPVNEAAFAIHSEVHAARPDVVAACHTHSVYGKTWSSLGRLLDPITQDACAFYEDHALFDDYTGIVITTDEGRRLAAALGPHKAVILRNHGLLTVGRTVDEAAWWYLALERTCQAQLLAEAAGEPIRIDHKNAQLTASQVGTEIAARYSFMPLWDRIVTEQPDLVT